MLEYLSKKHSDDKTSSFSHVMTRNTRNTKKLKRKQWS